jgi:hypothetical protein
MLNNTNKLNWYKKAMALDPNAWRGEADPARLRQHQDVVKTPYGFPVRQQQNPKELEEAYSGVHFAYNAEQAALYAEGKATADDPPVLIEVYKQDLPIKTDIDAQIDQTLNSYLQDNKNDWNEIFNSNAPDEEKADAIMKKIDDDKNYWDTSDGDVADDAAEIIAQENQVIPPVVIENYLQSFTNDSKIVQEMQSLINGNIPEKLLTSVVGQFRVMHPIVSDRVREFT